MENFYYTIGFVVSIGLVLFVSHLFVDSLIGISSIYLVYLMFTKQFFHFIDKRKLVTGDLVFIKYRGKYRKAIVTCVMKYGNQIQVEYADKDLNIDLIKNNWYPLSRVILPDYMSKAAKLLYSDLEE